MGVIPTLGVVYKLSAIIGKLLATHQTKVDSIMRKFQPYTTESYFIAIGTWNFPIVVWEMFDGFFSVFLISYNKEICKGASAQFLSSHFGMKMS